MRASDLRALGLDPAAVLDLSISLNPLGVSPGMRAAIAAAPIDRYPDPLSWAGREALASHHGVAVERVVLGNGASELLWSLLRMLGARSRGVVIAEPAFGQVHAACAGLGLPMERVPPQAAEGGAPKLDLDALVRATRTLSPACVYLCNPATPVGTALDASVIPGLIDALSPAPVLLDESFLTLSDAHAQLRMQLPERAVRLRSLTKDFGIPGVRAGYAITPPDLAEELASTRPAWTVSAAAEAVAIQAPREEPYLARSRAHIESRRKALADALRDLGLAPLPSVAPYLTFRHPRAQSLAQRLLVDHGIALRDCTSFGLPDLLRTRLPGPEDLTRLVAALRASGA